jgi:hypothetical protein
MFSQLGKCFGSYWQGLDFGRTERALGAALGRECGSKSHKEVVAALILQLSKRASAVVAGHKACGCQRCPNTNVPLASPRIALVGSSPLCCAHLLVSASALLGLPCQLALGEQLVRGEAQQALRTARANNDPLLAEIGIIVVLDGHVKAPCVDCAVVYLCRTVADLDERVQAINIDG